VNINKHATTTANSTTKAKATMETAWDRMPEADDTYKTWLLADMTVDEFNQQTPLQRKELRTLFNGKLRCCF
jgi:hypothetical protein